MSDVSTTTAAIYQAVLDSLNSSGECGVLPPAPPGKSAYEVAVDNGFVGSEKKWLNSLTIEQENEIARLEARIVNAEKITKDRKYAASRLVGTNNGNLVEMTHTGFNGTGIGGAMQDGKGGSVNDIIEPGNWVTSFSDLPSEVPSFGALSNQLLVGDIMLQTYTDSYGKCMVSRRIKLDNMSLASWVKYYSSANTNLDSNGALKPSSPVLRVFNDRITGNDDGDTMAATYTKNGVGDYTITGTTGLRTDGWYVTIPNDMNGNPKVAIGTLDDTDGVITLKTYVRTFDMTTFKFGPDLKKPLDIPEGRWIDLRFNDLPEEQLVEPEEEPIVEEEEVPVEEDPKD